MVTLRPSGFRGVAPLRVIEGDFTSLTPDEVGEVNLVVTSPPYNVGIDYSTYGDSGGYSEYLEFTRTWLRCCYRILSRDGRLCLNVPLDKNQGGQQSVYADMVAAAKSVGLKYHTTIVWNEQNISRRTAWGSWLSASAPYVIAPVEMIVVFYKESWRRHNRGVSDITRDEFIEWTNGVWRFNGESGKRVGHPAPFPVELPLRCIRLFSYCDDVILDPFLGSGSTLLACLRTGRRGVGVDVDAKYCQLARCRLAQAESELGALEGA